MSCAGGCGSVRSTSFFSAESFVSPLVSTTSATQYATEKMQSTTKLVLHNKDIAEGQIFWTDLPTMNSLTYRGLANVIM